MSSRIQTAIILAESPEEAKSQIDMFLKKNKHQIKSIASVIPYVNLQSNEYGITVQYYEYEEVVE